MAASRPASVTGISRRAVAVSTNCAPGPPMPAAFLRPRLGVRELITLLRNLFGSSGFGFRELRLLATALRSKTLPGGPTETRA